MRGRIRTVTLGPLVGVLLVGTVLVPSTADARTVPGSGCRVFPASNIWNTRIDALPVHEMSDTWLRSAHADSTDLHPDFGPPSYGLPFDVVGRHHPKVDVRFAYDDESESLLSPFRALMKPNAPASYVQILENMPSLHLTAVFGEEDNAFKP